MAENKKKKPEAESQELSVPQTPSEITSENLHLVDFDNLKVRLVCLITIPNAFTQVSTFLKRRGWEIFVTTEIKDALTQASTFNPDFVLMSVNHSYKKINQFPQVLTQTFNLPVIAFGEKTDAKTMGAIQTSRASFKIMGRLSGPTAQRKIKQILQDTHQVEEEEDSGHGFEAMGANQKEISFTNRTKLQQQDNTIKFSGRKIKKGEMILEKNQTSMKSASESKGYNPFAKGGTQEGSGLDKTGAAYSPDEQSPLSDQKEAKQKAPDEVSLAAKIQNDKEEMAAAMKELGSQIGSGQLDDGSDSVGEESVDLQGPANGELHSIDQKGTENKSKGSAESGSIENKSDNLVADGSTNEANLKSAESDGANPDENYKAKQEKKVPTMESEYVGRSGDKRNHVREVDERSFIEKATIEIVQAMRAEEFENQPGLRLVRRVALLSVGHKDHKGYFMIAGHDFGMSLDEFVQEFTDHFKKHCMKKNHIIEFGDYINMDCPDYDFFDNGEEGLEFNYVTSFGTGEVGVKFIHDEEAWAHAEAPEDHDKSLIKASQVVEDKPLEIDLFVHLQRNDKYFKIVSTDSELSSDRKERLVEKETEVFINNEDVGSYRSFQTKHKALKAINKTVQRTTKKKAS